MRGWLGSGNETWGDCEAREGRTTREAKVGGDSVTDDNNKDDEEDEDGGRGIKLEVS